MSVVDAVHPEAPLQVSRRNTSFTEFASPATRLLAFEAKAMKRPSEVMAISSGNGLLSSFGPAGLSETDTSMVEGPLQPVAPAGHVSRRYTFLFPLVASLTRVEASEAKATKRPSGLITPN